MSDDTAYTEAMENLVDTMSQFAMSVDGAAEAFSTVFGQWVNETLAPALLFVCDQVYVVWDNIMDSYADDIGIDRARWKAYVNLRGIEWSMQIYEALMEMPEHERPYRLR